MLTLKRSERKSSRCSAVNDFHLIQVEGEDFWKFYCKNRKVIDTIIDVQLSGYRNQLDVDDARQEILLRLHRCEVLKKYDSAKARLNTYLTGVIQGYVSSLLVAQRRQDNHFWNPWPSIDVNALLSDSELQAGCNT